MSDAVTLSQFQVRIAETADIDACADILNHWIDATDWMPRIHAAQDVQEHYRNRVFREREVLVADAAGEVVGFLALKPAPEWLVTALYVAEGARGHRVGTTLLDEAKTRSASGLQLWTFVANKPARAFYAAHGFVEVRRTEGENDEGLPDILLAWRGSDG